MIDISYALTVEGWMAESELEYLAGLAEDSNNDLIEKKGRILELGSWKGRSTSVLAQHTQGLVIAVDTWRGSVEHQPQLKGRPASGVLQDFTANVSRYGNVWPLIANSQDAAHIVALARLKFDLIFIDASHDYESVKADIQAWMPFLSRWGVLCGHDYMRWGVKKAVHELVPHHRLVPNTSIWSTEGV
jgi:predicted O-methyltransferase YrrM